MNINTTNMFLQQLNTNPTALQQVCNDIMRLGFSTFLTDDGQNIFINNPFLKCLPYNGYEGALMFVYYRSDSHANESLRFLVSQINKVEFDILEYYYDHEIEAEVCKSHSVTVTTPEEWVNTVNQYLQMKQHKKMGICLDFRSYTRSLYSFAYNY